MKTINHLDLFSGIGGFHLGFQKAGFELETYFSEIDKYAIANYKYNFKNAHYVGKVQEVKTQNIQGVDILTFGSPCQDISNAGKKAGIFGTRSKLFFDAIGIIDRLRPKVFVFENVKRLLYGNKGKDFEVILREIANLGVYDCQWQLINTAWLLPQNRERLFLVGSLRKIGIPRLFPLIGGYEENEAKNARIKVLGRYGNYRQNIVFSDQECSPTLVVGKGSPIGFVKIKNKIRYLQKKARF